MPIGAAVQEGARSANRPPPSTSTSTAFSSVERDAASGAGAFGSPTVVTRTYIS